MKRPEVCAVESGCDPVTQLRAAGALNLGVWPIAGRTAVGIFAAFSLR